MLYYLTLISHTQSLVGHKVPSRSYWIGHMINFRRKGKSLTNSEKKDDVDLSDKFNLLFLQVKAAKKFARQCPTWQRASTSFTCQNFLSNILLPFEKRSTITWRIGIIWRRSWSKVRVELKSLPRKRWSRLGIWSAWESSKARILILGCILKFSYNFGNKLLNKTQVPFNCNVFDFKEAILYILLL